MAQRSEDSEHEKWRRLLHPLITGMMVALMTAVTLYIQHKDSGASEARITAIEIEHKSMQNWQDRADIRIEALKEYKNGGNGRK